MSTETMAAQGTNIEQYATRRTLGQLSATGQYIPPAILSKVSPKKKVEPVGYLSDCGIPVCPLAAMNQAAQETQGEKHDNIEMAH